MNSTNPPLDLRVRRTYKFLWQALVALMTERDFESITVTEICDRAMVHRTTFYKHYEDKYGLLFHGMQDQLNALFDEVDARLDKSVTGLDKPQILPHLVILFEHILKHEQFYRLMLCGDGIGKFYVLFRKSLVERFMALSQEQFPQSTSKDTLRNALRAQSHVGALLGTISWWLENNCPYPPEEMAHYLWEDAFSHTAMRWDGEH